MSEDIFLTIVAFPLMFAFMGWLIWAVLEWLRIRHKSQLQNKILEKFTTVQEFNDFIQSKEGNKFLKFVSYNGLAPRQKILSSLSRGIIISFIGVSLILIGRFCAAGRIFSDSICDAVFRVPARLEYLGAACGSGFCFGPGFGHHRVSNSQSRSCRPNKDFEGRMSFRWSL